MTHSPESMLGAARVVVTGGSGFMGTNLVAGLLDHGAQVLSLDVQEPAYAGHQPYWRRLDVCDRQALERALGEFLPTSIVHMAARTDLDGRTAADYTVNVDGTDNLIEAAARVPSVERIVFCSSRMVCPIGYEPEREDEYSPENAYGASKAEMERHIRRDAIDAVWTIARPTSIWGPWFGVPYRTFFLSVAHRRYVHPKGRMIPKSFGYVGNTVYQLLQLLTAPPAAVDKKMFYLADYEPIEVGAWARRIAGATGSGKIREVPAAILKAVAVGGDLARTAGMRNPPLTSFRLRNLLTPMVHDLGAIREVAPDLPYGVDEGIAHTVDWLRMTGAIEPSDKPDSVTRP